MMERECFAKTIQQPARFHSKDECGRMRQVRVSDDNLYNRPIVTVGALIFNPGGEVLMLRTHKWSDLWGIPGGKTKLGESSVDALRREVKEETDLEISDIQFVLVQDCIHSQEFYRDAHFVLLNYRCRCGHGAAVTLNDEADDYRWVTPHAALKMDLNTPTRILVETVLAKTES
jgi:ADP-ribose pyrophosphatase YjhB (NUDIX family)